MGFTVIYVRKGQPLTSPFSLAECDSRYKGKISPQRRQTFFVKTHGSHKNFSNMTFNSWFSHDITKIQTKKLSLLLSFYFHMVLQHLKTFIQTIFWLKKVLHFATLDACISKLCLTQHLADSQEKLINLGKTFFRISQV